MCAHNKVEVDTGRMANYLDGPLAAVDERLAPLIEEFWARGIAVDSDACQELRPGLASVTFWSPIDITDFLEVAQRDYKVVLETGWYTTEVDNEPLKAYVDLSVLFPIKDIARLTRLIQATPMPPEPMPAVYGPWLRRRPMSN